MTDCDAYDYLTENSAFILTLVGLFGVCFLVVWVCVCSNQDVLK